MTKGRLEAFSDGVIAIIITIMVLELKAPHEPELEALRSVLPGFLSYVLSFIYVAIYWNNHHHIFHAVERVSGMTLWANLHLLFWLSLIPFVTRWMGESHFATWPVACYGALMLMRGCVGHPAPRFVATPRTPFGTDRALGRNLKEWISLLIYIVAIGVAFVNTWLACALYAFVAVIWFVPDRRVEREIEPEK